MGWCFMAKVTLSISDDIINKLDLEGAAFHTTRSGFVTDLIKQHFNGATASTTGDNRDSVVKALQGQVDEHTKTIKDLTLKVAELKDDKIFLQQQLELITLRLPEAKPKRSPLDRLLGRNKTTS